MAEELKDLIEKIQQEGIKAAADKAKEIELEAKRRAGEIIEDAKRQAREVLSKGAEEVGAMQEGAHASLKQAARDLLLTLKKEINAVLDRLILLDVRKALEPKEVVKIISAFFKESVDKEGGDIVISLSSNDAKEVEKALLGELAGQIKKGITLKASEDIGGGFTISYDAGKSHFDFTDSSLAAYVASYVKPRLGELLKESESAKGAKIGTKAA